jgi:hypothetical protein
MALKTNMKDLTPSRLRLRREITLLSHGFSCPDAFPDGRIVVYPWDADVDAWAVERAGRGLKNFMWDLLAKVCDLNGCPLEKFVVGDVSTVLLVSRALARANKVMYVAKCPECGHEHQDVITVPDELERVGEKSADYPGYDVITLPDCKDVVKIRPLLIGDFMAVENRPAPARQKYPDRLCRTLIPVVSVNDTTPDSFDELAAWYEALTPADKQYFVTQQDALYPHLNTDLDWTCDACGHKFVVPLVFNDKFFRERGGDLSGTSLAGDGKGRLGG